MSYNQVSNYVNFDASTIVFSKEVKKEIPNKTGGPGIRFYRIPVSVRRPDGSLGKLIFAPNDLFTFGVSANKNDSGVITGYTLPLTLWNKDGPTDNQKAFITTIENVLRACKEHLVNIRKAIMKPTLTFDALCDLDKILYYKLGEDGERIPDRGPAMYPKLFTKTNDGMMDITSGFIDSHGNDIDPMSLIGKYGHASPALFIDNIYIGAKISLQVYVGEAIIKLVNSGHRGILPRPKADETLHTGDALQFNSVSAAASAPVSTTVTEQEDDDIILDEDAPVVDTPPPPPRAAPKRLPPKSNKK